MNDWAASVECISRHFDKLEGKVVLGVDGIVDDVWQIVSSRKNIDEYVLFEKMTDFAKSVYDTGGGGYANEILPKRRTYGGFTANTGKALGQLGANPLLLGMFSTDDGIDPVFKEFREKYNLISVGKTSVTRIFEFSDGKIILPYLAERTRFNWDALVKAVPLERLSEIFADSDIVGLGYWSSIQFFDEILTNICERFLAKKKIRMFFDFADLRKRSREALDYTLGLLARLNKHNPMTLSLNENEAELLYSYMGKKFTADGFGVEETTDYIRRQIAISELIVHTPYFAAASSESEGTAYVMQRYCKNPVITTGAGDNFNGGYIAASMNKGALSLKERLFVGNATTGFYVRNGYSPDADDLKNEVREMLNASKSSTELQF